MVGESLAVSRISADHVPAGLERLPPNKRHRRTTRRVEIPGIVGLRKVAEAVAIAALRQLAAVDRMQAVVIAVVADPTVVVAATAVAVDPTAEAMAGSANLITYINNDLPSAR